MIKKLIKFALILALIAAVLAVGAFFALKRMYPPEKLKQMAQNYVSQNFHRELSFDSISFTWIGFTLNNVALSEESTFQDGTFIKANQLTAHIAVKPLLQKRIEISTIEADGLQVNIIAQKDGTFNFDTLLTNSSDSTTSSTSSTQEGEESNPLVLIAKKINLTQCDLVYKDEQTGMRTALEDLNIQITDFSLNKPFDTQINFTADISGTGQPDLSLPVTLQFTTFLADLQLPQAYATLSQATAQYKTVHFNMQGDIKNFENPSVNLTGALSGIDNKVLSELAPDLPNFQLPTLNLSVQANANLDAQTATISQAKLSVQDSSLVTKGTVSWKDPGVTYNLSGSLTAIVNQLVQMTDTLNGFRPTGTVTASFKATEKKDFGDVSGNVLLKDVSVLYDPFTLTQLNGNIAVASLENISSSSLTGKLNGESFTGSFSYKQLPTLINLACQFRLDKLVLAKFPDSSADDTPKTSSAATSTPATSASSLPMNIQADVAVGAIKIPYFQSNGLTLNANLTNVTDTLAHTSGTVNFNIQPGKITNLDDFVKDSKIAKILLLPVSIIKKVSGFLHLNLFPEKSEDGATIAFTQGVGAYTFTDGVMNIDKTEFNSSATNISATGTANFKTDALNMQAKATLLTQAAPISFKITGTMSDPKGKLDVVNTVTSVVGGLLNGNAAKSAANGTASLTKGTATVTTNTVKDTVSTAADVVKGIGGLFKKKNTDKK